MDTHASTPAGTWMWTPTARRRDAVYQAVDKQPARSQGCDRGRVASVKTGGFHPRKNVRRTFSTASYRTLTVALAGWGLALVATGYPGTVSAAETPSGKRVVVNASPSDEEEGAVVPAGGVIAARRASQGGNACGRADCQKCRGSKVCRHKGACGPEVPGCPAHCPVRPDRFGYYQTNWRRWPGQTVVPASFSDAAVPVSPPRSVVPGMDDEAGSPAEDEQAGADTGKAELPGPDEKGGNAPAFESVKPAPETAQPERAEVPETPPETPVEPAAPRKPAKPQEDLFEQSRAPQRSVDAAPGRLVQWRAKRPPTGGSERLAGASERPAGASERPAAADDSRAVQASATAPAAAANLPAAVGESKAPPKSPSNPLRR